MSEASMHSPSRRKENSGSPGLGEPEYLAVGLIRRPHGVQGELLMDVDTDFPERLTPGKTVYVGERRDPFQINSIRAQDKTLLLKLKNVDDVDQAGKLRNKRVYVKTKGLPPLPEGEYYFHQLVGLKVVDETGNLLGSLVEILKTGANDVYVVRAEDGTETLLPAIDPVILEVDLERSEIRVRPPEWL
ncbi:MAG: ribosome maturation factor RimM [Anaerolineaceae bacterium]|nr:ribosome maturation factor RimM [Anaerolineaceae bacterium]